MKSEYPFKDIEFKWQSEWDSKGCFTTNLQEAKNPYYCLMMFPYRLENFMLGMVVIISLVMLLQDTKKCKALMC